MTGQTWRCLYWAGFSGLCALCSRGSLRQNNFQRTWWENHLDVTEANNCFAEFRQSHWCSGENISVGHGSPKIEKLAAFNALKVTRFYHEMSWHGGLRSNDEPSSVALLRWCEGVGLCYRHVEDLRFQIGIGLPGGGSTAIFPFQRLRKGEGRATADARHQITGPKVQECSLGLLCDLILRLNLSQRAASDVPLEIRRDSQNASEHSDDAVKDNRKNFQHFVIGWLWWLCCGFVLACWGSWRIASIPTRFGVMTGLLLFVLAFVFICQGAFVLTGS